jgi:plastocyanin
MQTLMNQLRFAAARLSPCRSAVVALLAGPLVGALLAFGAVAAQESGNEVKIDNFTFTPPELTVPVGTTVKFVNHDDIPHSVVNKDKIFRSNALDTDDSFTFTFANAGTYDYFCGLHPHMTGKIIVK